MRERPVSRRSMLTAGAVGLGALALPQLFRSSRERVPEPADPFLNPFLNQLAPRDLFQTLPPPAQEAFLHKVTGQAIGKTSLGDLQLRLMIGGHTSDVVCFNGAPIGKLPVGQQTLFQRPGLFVGYDDVSDRATATFLTPLERYDNLKRGFPCMLSQTLHQQTHFIQDSASPEDTAIDLLVKYQLISDGYVMHEPPLSFQLVHGPFGRPAVLAQTSASAFIAEYGVGKYGPHGFLSQLYPQRQLDLKFANAVLQDGYSAVARHREGVLKGGFVLMEVGARIPLMNVDYSTLTLDSFREQVIADVKMEPMIVSGDVSASDEQIGQAFDQIVRMYGLLSVIPSYKTDPVRLHLEVQRAIGRSLFSWDPDSQSFTQLTGKLIRVSDMQTTTDKDVSGAVEEWFERHRGSRVDDMETIRTIFEQTVDELLNQMNWSNLGVTSFGSRVL